VQEGRLVGIRTCDDGATRLSIYEGPDTDRDTGSYWGLTISINNEVRYYIFSPNPDSMSPITLSFLKDNDGKLRKVTSAERDKQLRIDAPNLYGYFYGKKNDCKYKKVETEK